MDNKERDKMKVHPRERAGKLSKVSFWFTAYLFWKTYRTNKLEERDLCEVIKSLKSQDLGNQIEDRWEKGKNNGKYASIYRVLWSCYGREYLWLGLIQLLMRTSVVILIPKTLSKLVSYFQSGQTDLTRGEAYLLAALLIMINLINITYLQNYLLSLSELGTKIRTAVCSLMYRKCLKLSSTALSEITTGKIMTLMTKDIRAFETIIFYGNDVWIGFVQAGIVCFLIYRQMGVSAFMGLGLFILVMPIQIYCGMLTSKLRLISAKKTDERLQVSQETLSAIKVIRMYAWEKTFQQKIFQARKIEINVLVKVFLTKNVILLVGALTSKIAFYLLVMTYVWLGNSISAELIYYVLTLFQRIRQALSVIIPKGIAESAELYASVKRIENLLNAPDVVPNHALQTIIERPQVNMKNMSIDVLQQEILRNINISIDSGLTILIGPIGCGKSILLKTILKDIIPRDGTLLVQGTISYASQEPWIFASTVRQNIVFGEKFNRSRYEEVVKVCALNFDISKFEKGDHLLIGDNGTNLSKGQKARINLARCIYKDSDIYLLDDCLSALDAHVREYVFGNCIKRFLKDKLCIFVTQDPQYFHRGDNLLRVEGADVSLIKNYSKDIDADLSSIVQYPSILEALPDKEMEAKHLVSEESGLLRSLDKPTNSNIYTEDKKSGRVDLDVYKKYIFHGGGGTMFLLIIISFIVTHSSRSYTEKMVSNWVNVEQNLSGFRRNNSTDTIEYTILTESRLFLLIHYSILTVAQTLISIITAFLLFNFTRKASNGLHNSMVKSVINAVTHFFDTNLTANILNRFSKDLTIIDELIPFILYDFLEIMFGLCGIIILISSVSWIFFVPILCLLSILYYIRLIYIPTGRNLQRLDASTRSPVIGHLTASLDGLSTIRAFGAQNLLIREFDRHQDLNTSASYTAVCCSRAFAYILDIFCNIFIAVVIIRFLISDKDTSVGEVGLAITQAFLLSGSVQYGLRLWAEMENKMTSVERALEYTDVKPELNNNGKLLDNWPKLGSITFEEVTLVYKNLEECVLNKISFRVDGGEKIGIVGRTGAGKTSIINILFRLYDYQGKITIDGIDIRTVSLDFLRKSMAVIPQDPILFSGTIRSNIDPLEEYCDSDIWRAIEDVQLNNVVESLDTKIAESGSNFSSGQRQLICLARAILSQNRIIVLDEATANMDEETDSLINKTINKIFTSCTRITVAHRLQSVMGCDKVMVLDKGSIEEYDNPQYLLQRKDSSFYKMVEKAGLLGS